MGKKKPFKYLAKSGKEIATKKIVINTTENRCVTIPRTNYRVFICALLLKKKWRAPRIVSGGGIVICSVVVVAAAAVATTTTAAAAIVPSALVKHLEILTGAHARAQT